MGFFKKLFCGKKSSSTQGDKERNDALLTADREINEVGRDEMINSLMADAEDDFNRECRNKNVVFPSFETRNEAYEKWREEQLSAYQKMDDEWLGTMYRLHIVETSLDSLARNMDIFKKIW